MGDRLVARCSDTTEEDVLIAALAQPWTSAWCTQAVELDVPPGTAVTCRAEGRTAKATRNEDNRSARCITQ